ncbi:MAG: hypothetical protein QM802_07615 [Agriterribacter sp.]
MTGSISREQVSISPLAKIFGTFISWIFHPLFIGLYITLCVVYGIPEYFIGIDAKRKLQWVFIYIINGVFFPVISVLLCKALGFIQSVYLNTQKERIILYSISMIFFFWTFYVFKNITDVPAVMAQMSLGIFLAVVLAFLANIYIKISMHATGVGGMVGFFTVLLYASPVFVSVPLAIAILITGLTCTARLLVSDHEPGDIVFGLIAGFISQWIAAWFIA